MAKIALMGYGTVGSGVYDIVKINAEKLQINANGEEVELRYILDIRDFPDHPEKKLFTKDFNDILNDDEISVVAEVMGGLHPAYEFTKSLLEAGKSVVTSNKELVATYGTELLSIAKKKNVNYLFEASVGGGIPIIRPIHQCLTANNIERIVGILNGTTNYILYQMIKNKKTFDAALADAQAKGYAEKNPAADIEGHDACRKIAILASLSSGEAVDYRKIATEGITNITLDDVKSAAAVNGVIKLISYAGFTQEGKVFAFVAPMLVKNSNLLSRVNNVFNAIMVTGDCVGDVIFYGQGAGKMPTASAVVADIVDAVRHKGRSKRIFWEKPSEDNVASGDSGKFAYFIRCSSDREHIIGSPDDCELITRGINNETLIITKKMTCSEKNKKLQGVSGVISCIRVLE